MNVTRRRRIPIRRGLLGDARNTPRPRARRRGYARRKRTLRVVTLTLRFPWPRAVVVTSLTRARRERLENTAVTVPDRPLTQ